MSPRVLDQLINGVALLLAALVAPHYLASPWLSIPLSLGCTWLAGQRLAEAIDLVRADRRGKP